MGQLKIASLAQGQKLALDTPVLIYFLEKHPVHFEVVRELFRAIEAGRFTGVISTLLFAELLVPAYRAEDPKRANTLLNLLTTFPNLQICPLDSKISAEAARLRALYGLRTPPTPSTPRLRWQPIPTLSSPTIRTF